MNIAKQIKKEFSQGKMFMSYGGLKATGMGFFFLIPIILAAFLSPHELGAYSLGMMIVYFFNSSLILSSESPFVICGVAEINERRKVNRSLTTRTIILLGASAFFISVVLLFRKQISDFTLLTKSQTYLLMLVFTGKTIGSFLRCLFVVLNKRIRESVYQLCSSFIALAYILLIYLTGEITLDRVFPVFFIAPIISSAIIPSRAEFKKGLPLSFNKENFFTILGYTRWVALGGTAVYFLNWGDNIILRRFVPMDEIGVYNLGYQFFKGMIMLLTIIKVYFLPFISQHINDKEKIRYYLDVKRKKLFLAGLIFAGSLYFILPVFITAVYKGQYQDSILVFRILLSGAVFALFSMFYDPIFSSLKKFKIAQSITVAGVSVNLLLDYILVSHMGFIGAAIATAISYLLMSVIKTVYFVKYCKPMVT